MVTTTAGKTRRVLHQSDVGRASLIGLKMRFNLRYLNVYRGDERSCLAADLAMYMKIFEFLQKNSAEAFAQTTQR